LRNNIYRLHHMRSNYNNFGSSVRGRDLKCLFLWYIIWFFEGLNSCFSFMDSLPTTSCWTWKP